MRASALLGLLALLSASPVVGQAPIIDMHLHAFGFDEYGLPIPPNEITGRSPTYRSDREAMEATLAAMRAAGIVRAVASGPIRHVTRWRAAAAGTVLGGAYIGPRDPLPAIADLRRLARTGEISVLGEFGLQYRGISPNSPDLNRYWALAQELDLPVGIHTGLGDAGTPYGCCPGFRARLGNPLLLEDVLVRFPKLRRYLMHAGYPFPAGDQGPFYDNAARFLRLTEAEIRQDHALGQPQ